MLEITLSTQLKTRIRILMHTFAEKLKCVFFYHHLNFIEDFTSLHRDRSEQG